MKINSLILALHYFINALQIIIFFIMHSKLPIQCLKYKQHNFQSTLQDKFWNAYIKKWNAKIIFLVVMGVFITFFFFILMFFITLFLYCVCNRFLYVLTVLDVHSRFVFPISFSLMKCRTTTWNIMLDKKQKQNE